MKNEVDDWGENIIQQINLSSNPCKILDSLVSTCIVKKLNADYPLTVDEEIYLQYCLIFCKLHKEHGC